MKRHHCSLNRRDRFAYFSSIDPQKLMTFSVAVAFKRNDLSFAKIVKFFNVGIQPILFTNVSIFTVITINRTVKILDQFFPDEGM